MAAVLAGIVGSGFRDRSDAWAMSMFGVSASACRYTDGVPEDASVTAGLCSLECLEMRHRSPVLVLVLTASDDKSDVDVVSYVPVVLAGLDALQRGILTC